MFFNELTPILGDYLCRAFLLSPPAEQDVENLLLSARDPITLQTFNKPVSLVPCGHSLSLDSAQLMYNLTDSLQIRRPGTCPTCRAAVVACIPNHSLRQLLEGLISRVEASAATVLPCVTIRLAEEVKPVVPFPGKGARFECAHAWSNQYSGASLCRSMELRSVTPASFLQEISVCGYQDGSIMFVMSFRRTSGINIQQMFREEDIFEKYVSDSGFQPQLPRTSFYARTPAELNWVLTVLANHNEIPQQEFRFMKRLVEAHGWKTVEQEMRRSSSSSSSASSPSSSSPSSSEFEFKFDS